MVGGLGYFPRAPGTVGSLFGALLFVGVAFAARALGVGPLAVSSSAGPIALGLVYSLGVLMLFMVGVWASGRAELDFGHHDDGRIVIDEVVGQLITLSPLLFFGLASPSSGRVQAPGDFLPFFFWVVTGFVLFRLFDVWKPGAVRWAEHRFEGGLGVMADDVVAGIHGGTLLLASLLASLSILGSQVPLWGVA